MDIKDMCNNGVYAFKDNSTNKIVYVGSTFASLVERLAQHLKDAKSNRHHNNKLSKLINGGDFDFIALETGFTDKKELLNKERYYTEIYDTHNNGYNVNVGGCRFIENTGKNKNIMYDLTKDKAKSMDYIKNNYLNKRITLLDKQTIINVCNNIGFTEIRSTNFVKSLKRLGFVVERLSTKKDFLIKENILTG